MLWILTVVIYRSSFFAYNRYSHGEQREIREGLRRRVSKALAPLEKARGKTAGKQASKREKTTRQSQKRELEATAAKEK